MNQIRDLATRQLPVFLYCFVGLGYLLQGIRYLSSSQQMPYHMAVIDSQWESLEAGYQTLFLGLLKGFGAGSFGMGLVIMLLAIIPLRQGAHLGTVGYTSIRPPLIPAFLSMSPVLHCCQARPLFWSQKPFWGCLSWQQFVHSLHFR